MSLNINLNDIENIEQISKWKAMDGSLFYRAEECIIYQMKLTLENAVNNFFHSDYLVPTLEECIDALNAAFELTLNDMLQLKSIQEMLNSGPYTKDSFNLWVTNIRGCFVGWKHSLKEIHALELTNKSELIVPGWKNAQYPMYKIVHISLAPKESAYFYLSFKASSHSADNRCLGPCEEDITIQELGRYIKNTKELSTDKSPEVLACPQ